MIERTSGYFKQDRSHRIGKYIVERETLIKEEDVIEFKNGSDTIQYGLVVGITTNSHDVKNTKPYNILYSVYKLELSETQPLQKKFPKCKCLSLNENFIMTVTGNMIYKKIPAIWCDTYGKSDFSLLEDEAIQNTLVLKMIQSLEVNLSYIASNTTYIVYTTVSSKYQKLKSNNDYLHWSGFNNNQKLASTNDYLHWYDFSKNQKESLFYLIIKKKYYNTLISSECRSSRRNALEQGRSTWTVILSAVIKTLKNVIIEHTLYEDLECMIDKEDIIQVIKADRKCSIEKLSVSVEEVVNKTVRCLTMVLSLRYNSLPLIYVFTYLDNMFNIKEEEMKDTSSSIREKLRDVTQIDNTEDIEEESDTDTDTVEIDCSDKKRKRDSSETHSNKKFRLYEDSDEDEDDESIEYEEGGEEGKEEEEEEDTSSTSSTSTSAHDNDSTTSLSSEEEEGGEEEDEDEDNCSIITVDDEESCRSLKFTVRVVKNMPISPCKTPRDSQEVHPEVIDIMY